jgi:CheY-like chemotaxis protein
MIDTPSTGAPLQGARILVVEDEMLVCMLLKDALAELGGEIVPATHAREAIIPRLRLATNRQRHAEQSTH